MKQGKQVSQAISAEIGMCQQQANLYGVLLAENEKPPPTLHGVDIFPGILDGALSMAGHTKTSHAGNAPSFRDGKIVWH